MILPIIERGVVRGNLVVYILQKIKKEVKQKKSNVPNFNAGSCYNYDLLLLFVFVVYCFLLVHDARTSAAAGPHWF